MVIARPLGAVADPVELFAAVADAPGAFFIDGGGPALAGGEASWSFFGAEPAAVLRSRGGRTVVERGHGGTPPSQGHPLDEIEDLLGGSSPADGVPFAGGAVGFFGYDLKHAIERLPEPAGKRETDDLWLGFHRAVAAWEKTTGRATLIAHTSGCGGRAEAERALDRLHRRLQGPRPATRAAEPAPSGTWQGSFTREEYLAAVRQLKDWIAEGEIYQANLSQRFTRPDGGGRHAGFALWRRLRAASPAPCAAYMRCGEIEILSASPERFLKRDGDRVETRPIKGTRPRGASPAEDLRLAAALAASEKDAAEHVMIVDVERNDLGRVCRAGTVSVSRLRAVESYAQVHHLVSTIEGTLRPGVRFPELLRATFPGGSITGAPKLRAMELLDRLEPVRRGPYCGAAGWIDASGNCDLQIAIRTLYRTPRGLWYQVGGGIVADSDPQAEFEETLVKGKAIAGLFGPRAA